MDIERHVVSVDGEQVSLPLKEFELLEMLLRNSGRVLTRGQLIDRVWGSDYVGDTKTLDVHVKRLRSKIEPDPVRAAFPGHRPRPGLQVRAVSRPAGRQPGQGGPESNAEKEGLPAGSPSFSMLCRGR